MVKHKRRADTRGGAIPYGNCSTGLSKLIADRTVIEGRSKGFNMAGLSRPDQAMRHNPTDGATSAAGAERAAPYLERLYGSSSRYFCGLVLCLVDDKTLHGGREGYRAYAEPVKYGSSLEFGRFLAGDRLASR